MTALRLVVIAASAWGGFAAGSALLVPSARWWLAAVGAGTGLLIVLLERRARAIDVGRLCWGVVGGATGLAIGRGLGASVDALVPAAGGIARGWLGLAGA